MARPLKQVVDYFPHMVHHGKTLLVLRNEFGNDGYAFWFSLLELLCKAEGQFYDYSNPSSWRLLLAETHVKEDIATGILATLADIEAVDKDLFSNKIIWVQNLVDNLDQVYDRRSTGKPEKPVYVDKNPTLKGINVNNNRVNVNNNPASKVNNTIQYNTKQVYGEFGNVLLTEKEYEKLKGIFSGSLPEKIEELSTGIASKGYKYKSHYATILSWARKHEKEGGQNGANQRHTQGKGTHLIDRDKYTDPPFNPRLAAAVAEEAARRDGTIPERQP